MQAFRSAKTTEELEKVQEIKYDNYFFNFEDPKVFKEMTSGKQAKAIWKKTYGFDFVSFNDNDRQPVENYQCIKYCYKQELLGAFAKECKKKGGVFKCCQSW